MAVSQSTNSDSDTEIQVINAPVIPTKKHRFENGKSDEENDQGIMVIASQPVKKVMDTASGMTQARIEVSDSHSDIDIPLKHRTPVSENSNRHLTAHAQSSDQNQKIITVDRVSLSKAAIRGPIHSKHAATQLNDLDVPNLKARVSFASARTTTSKPFVALDPASIRRGFQEGGASSKKEDLKKCMYIISYDY